ncbi:hypothetical protein JIMMER1_39 [Brevibacillus phage Jimmer1]|uniref:Uncharacterized protein n=4 Tax=Jimmervirus TaxID=1984788 RepID=U5P468_9CAUD|nr:hypothetical protein AVV10_gp041 [Brevibacillus phage Osiris]YP_009226349.1 hypothetical protein AXJ21_gp039 [Brevibacillus phage Jimmer1]YP_009606466.1 hypothetical protein FDI01_gp039 [Brevibacillus phage Jimmer2]ALA48051.1 hypothetical protein POWDER_41 [Brevibacillus phage Powder]AGY37116.1 hypothetical protein JIMMER2_39 [Brevibacillus phage Jimmer2]AGY37123.1 hypothetical protein JIMMER1_39 [Brevibacillus phage Jimmer1]ALA07376.1 hypothetical protein OSIRIS_41 [Brevibacillus phage Os
MLVDKIHRINKKKILFVSLNRKLILFEGYFLIKKEYSYNEKKE